MQAIKKILNFGFFLWHHIHAILCCLGAVPQDVAPTECDVPPGYMCAHDGSLADRNVVLTPLCRSDNLPGLPSRGGVPSSGASLHLARQTSGTALGTRSLTNACWCRPSPRSPWRTISAAISMVPGQGANAARTGAGYGASSGDRPLGPNHSSR